MLCFNKTAIDIAFDVISRNKNEFIDIKSNTDPRLDASWLEATDIMMIYTELVNTIGGKPLIHNRQDLEYKLKRPLMRIDGAPEYSRFEKICRCVYDICDCFCDCKAQMSAIIFITLCKLNGYNVSFELGDIYEIFPKISMYYNGGNRISYDKFERHMKDHIVNK